MPIKGPQQQQLKQLEKEEAAAYTPQPMPPVVNRGYEVGGSVAPLSSPPTQAPSRAEDMTTDQLVEYWKKKNARK